jgi:hypothetical protein
VVIYEPTTWDLIYTGEEVNHLSRLVTNPPVWLVQLLTHCQKAEQDVQVLADTKNDEDAMEIDISYLRNYYKLRHKNRSELIRDITQDTTLQYAFTQEHFNMILKDCQMFGLEIWTAIGGL